MTSQNAIEVHQVCIPSDTTAGMEIQEQIIAQMEQQAFPSRDVFCTRLALSEAVANAIRHGNRMSPDKQVLISWSISTEKVQVVITDEGEGFCPDNVVDPTEDENLERPGGRGVMLIHSFMDVVNYNSRGNQITMEKHRSTE